MKNPLTMAKDAVGSLPMLDRSVPKGTFSRGFMSGATNGALMMGIFYGVASAVTVAFPALAIVHFGWSMVAGIAAGVFSTGVFSGVMATRKASESGSASHASVAALRRDPVHAPESIVSQTRQAANDDDMLVSTPGPWAERVDRPASGRDRISQIVADGTLSDKERASAILKERESSAALSAER